MKKNLALFYIDKVNLKKNNHRSHTMCEHLWMTKDFLVSITMICQISLRSWHGLWTPNEAFFNQKTIWADKFWGIWGIFDPFISTYLLWVPCPCFPLINHYFYKKVSPNTYLGLGFEFGRQRIRDLVIVCPKSVVFE